MENETEWLETDGLGGFASGTSSGIPRRRYHALLVSSTKPPTHRFCLVNSVDTYAIYEGRRFPLSSFEFGPRMVNPRGDLAIESFDTEPWPCWTYRFPEVDLVIVYQVMMRKESSMVMLSWKQLGGRSPASLEVRPLLSCRDYHSLHKENSVFSFHAAQSKHCVEWSPYQSCPTISAYYNGSYEHQPLWYYNFYYSMDRDRGFDAYEDLASPGIFRWDLAQDEAHLVMIGASDDYLACFEEDTISEAVIRTRQEESFRRSQFPSPLHKAGDAYLVRRDSGRTIIAGYPWFTDWGRDTFIAYRGLCLSSGRLEEGAEILSTWLKTISQGMIPNRFPDQGLAAEYNSVDASLWFVIASSAFLSRVGDRYGELSDQLIKAICEIVSCYFEGTRFRIRADQDALLSCGIPGTQLTWMDAKVNHVVFTPRVGKPVEIQALWINALKIASQYEKTWGAVYHQALDTFRSRFWNSEADCLYDVIDCDHRRGELDPSIRPNQIFAVGGLPEMLLAPEKANSVLKRVERDLLTPFGLRTLAPSDSRYQAQYKGTHLERDRAYHQGTVWPWLLGAFVEGWVRVNGASPEIKERAKHRFMLGMMGAVGQRDGVGHISEIHDGISPHLGRGCPFQAWSVAEFLRIFYDVLNESEPRVNPF